MKEHLIYFIIFFIVFEKQTWTYGKWWNPQEPVPEVIWRQMICQEPGIHKAAAQISLHLLPLCFGLWLYVGADRIFWDKEFGGG